jgi:hypothetical protein
MALKATSAQRLMTLAMIAGAELLLALPLGFLGSTPAAAQFFPFFDNTPRRAPPGFFSPFQAPVEAPKAPPVDYSRAPSPKKPDAPPTSTIVVMGDSMADWLAYGLEDAVSDMPGVGILRKHKTYSGLVRYETRSDLDWPHVARDILNAEKPAVVVMMLGLNDRQNIREQAAQPAARGAQPPAPAQQDQQQPLQDSEANPDLQIITPEPPRNSRGGVAEFRSDRWKDLYVKRIDDTIAALKSKGVPVIWVGLPPVRIARAMADNIYLNDLYRARAEKAGIIYVDVWDGFVDESGKYMPQGPDVEGQIRRLRAPDGVHFTKAGARKLAHYVEREISRVMSTRSVPVAFPTDESVQPAPTATLRPGIPASRPLAGPVVPLNLNTVSTSEELLAGGGTARPAAADPIATRVLIKGEPVAAPRGRADDFGWTARRDTTATPPAAEKTSSQTAMPAPEMPPPSASPPVERDPGKKPPGKQASQPEPAAQSERNPPVAKKPKPAATREAPRPPASVGADAGFVPFGSRR